MTRQKGMRPYWLVFLSVFLFWLLYGTVLVYAQVAKEYVAADGPKGFVLISEFMASNDNTLADEDGDYSDWIEIHNSDSTLVNLEGWYLTDEDDELTKWRFPSATLAPNSYLVVFASNKDRADAGSELHTNFKIKSSGEYLALVEPDGVTIAAEYAPEYPPQFEDVSYGLDALLNERYFTLPTPGEPNEAQSGDSNLGPLVSNATHRPSLPISGDAMTVTVTVQESLDPVDNVVLHYRVMYSDPFTTPMFDDGMHGDGAASDSVYGATIPASAAEPGEMVRYYITATDTEAHTSRWPLFHERTNSPEYLGTMIADEGITSTLPILYWFVEQPAWAETREGTRASLFYLDLFYDNIFVRLRGGESTSWPKNSLKFDFNQGHHFYYSPDEEPVEEFNLNTTYNDPSYIQQLLAWESYRDAGVPYSVAFPMRVQQNGAFLSVATFVEQPDKRYLERQGMDPVGAFYKLSCCVGLNSPTNADAQKQTRLDEDNSDLEAFIAGITLTGTAQTDYLFDNLNIPSVINYLAATVIMRDQDYIINNYYLYRDTEGTSEWLIIPWDKDRTFGYVHPSDLEYKHPLFGDSDHRFHNEYNYIIDAVYDIPITREMYVRRLRTLQDQLLKPAGTPPSELHYEPRIDQLVTQLAPDVALDIAAWGALGPFEDAIDFIRNDYLPGRRVELYETHGPEGNGLIPDAQLITATLNFGPLEFNPASGNRDEEYFTLLNPNSVTVDISGWSIANDVQYTFQPGVVIPAGGTLYVSPDVVAFRNRASSPTGGEGHFVQGGYNGQLSNTRGTIELYNTQGTLIDSTIFSATSPLAEQLIVSEINYNPPAEGEVDGDSFEFIELKNIMSTTLDLGGVRFTDGISYTFPATATLAPNVHLVLVRDQIQFATRYEDVTSAGVYDGQLSNGGETITLVDGEGSVISWFEYDDELPWLQTPDGDGYTLVRRDPPGDESDPCNWQASSNLYGSPGTDDPPGGTDSCLPTAVDLTTLTASEPFSPSRGLMMLLLVLGLCGMVHFKSRQ